MRREFFRLNKSIAGVALIGLGFIILYANLVEVANNLRDVLPATPGEALGVLPSVMLAAFRVAQSYGTDHQRFLHGALQHLAASLWPLALVVVGTVWSYDAGTDRVTTRTIQKFPTKDFGIHVENSSPRSTSN
jgi:hypothetical protein